VVVDDQEAGQFHASSAAKRSPQGVTMIAPASARFKKSFLNLIGFQCLLAAPDSVRVIRRLPRPINPQEVLGAKECNPRLSHRPSYQKYQAIRLGYVYYQDSDYKCVVDVILLEPD
jgi:hypothetical protein